MVFEMQKKMVFAQSLNSKTSEYIALGNENGQFLKRNLHLQYYMLYCLYSSSPKIFPIVKIQME